VKVRHAAEPLRRALGSREAVICFVTGAIGCVCLVAAEPALADDENSSRDAGGETTRRTTSTDASSPDEPDGRALAEQAKVAFNQGNQAYDQGNYRRAAEAFEQAHQLSPHSAVLFNAARAWWKLGESERAADDYAEAIRRGELTSEQTLRARSALASLRKKLGWIIVSGSPGTTVSIGHRKDAALPLTTHVAPGDHVLSLAQGSESWQQLVTVKADAPLSVVAQKGRSRDEITELPQEATSPTPAAGGHGQRPWGWVTLGVATALGAGAGVTGLFTLNSRNEFNGLNDGSPENVGAAQQRRDEAKTWRTVTNVLAISAGATGLTGFTLLITAPRGTTSGRGAEVMALALRPGSVEMSGRF
jgi:tetratricopeptide (TPR) repeat protein